MTAAAPLGKKVDGVLEMEEECRATSSEQGFPGTRTCSSGYSSGLISGSIREADILLQCCRLSSLAVYTKPESISRRHRFWKNKLANNTTWRSITYSSGTSAVLFILTVISSTWNREYARQYVSTDAAALIYLQDKRGRTHVP